MTTEDAITVIREQAGELEAYRAISAAIGALIAMGIEENEIEHAVKLKLNAYRRRNQSQPPR